MKKRIILSLLLVTASLRAQTVTTNSYTLATSGTQGNVHDYQSSSPTFKGSGQLAGTWLADGRNLDPQSAGLAFSSTSPTLGLNNLIGTDPNGVWTFFIADLSPGGQSTVQNVIMNIMTLPEPQSRVRLAVGLASLPTWRWRRVND